MLSYENIGRNIKAARERLNITQAEAASALKMSIQYYGKLERGETRQQIDRLAHISVLFSVPLECLFAGALPAMEFTNRPPTDDIEKHVIRVLSACNKERRDAILHLCEVIAHLR